MEHHASYFTDMIGLRHDLPPGKTYSDSSLYIPNVLARKRYRALPKLELVDDYPCHVVTSGIDTLWIDQPHGSCIRRRVQFLRTNESDPGSLSALWIAKDFARFDSDIWLPRQILYVNYAHPLDPPSLQGRINSVYQVTVKSIEVNSIQDNVFDMQFPPGTIVKDYIRKVEYTVPLGEDLLEDAIRHGNKFMSNEETGPHKPNTTFTFLLLSCPLIAIAILLVIRRSHRA